MKVMEFTLDERYAHQLGCFHRYTQTEEPFAISEAARILRS